MARSSYDWTHDFGASKYPMCFQSTGNLSAKVNSITRYHWISLDITGYHWISLDITGYHWHFVSFLINCYVLLLSSILWAGRCYIQHSYSSFCSKTVLSDSITVLPKPEVTFNSLVVRQNGVRVFFYIKFRCSRLDAHLYKIAKLWIQGNALVLSKELFHRYAEQTFELQV